MEERSEVNQNKLGNLTDFFMKFFSDVLNIEK